jgi:methyltransferase (TIGR00027 family)
MVRALANEGVTEVRGFSDPTAMALLPLPWRLVARWAVRRARRQGGQHPYVKDGKFDLIPLRTRVFDDAWHAAHSAGARQLVLLGAGLDGRAFRLPDIGDSAVFEVDEPATQALKRKRARALKALALRHVFVALDFERGALDDALAAAGLDGSAAVFWIWEGVTPYLTQPAQRATLDAVARCSGPGSRVAMTYVEPTDHQGELSRVRGLVQFLGEPFVGLMTRDAAKELLAGAGFDVVEDSGIDDWRRRYADGLARPTSAYRERIALAERRS